jgi:hypothetical protein
MGSTCRPGDECSNGLCQTSKWESAFYFSLMRRVEVSTSMICQIAGSGSFPIDTSTSSTTKTDAAVIVSTEEDRRQGALMTTSVVNDEKVSRCRPPNTTAAADKAEGRSCGNCGRPSVALYRRRGMLVCPTCADV